MASGGERFHLALVGDDGYSNQRVVVQVGMDGLHLVSSDTGRPLRAYPLSHIARWALRGPSLVLFTRAPSDASERAVTLAGDDASVRTLLDTLTCACMQMVELLAADADAEDASARAAAARPRGGLPAAGDVAWWEGAAKAGWLHSQGDHIRTWRRRWHVLKDGWLLRFASPEDAAKGPQGGARPRGALDLTLVTDVADGRDATGRPNSVRLAMSGGGAACYLADSETEAVEWASALEAGVAAALRAVAGVADAATAAAGGLPGAPADWAAKLAAGYGAAGGGGATGAGGRRVDAAPLAPPPSHVTIDYGGGAAPPSAPYFAYGDGGGGGSVAAGGIAGVAGVISGGGGSAPAPAYAGFASASGAYPSLPPDATINVAVPSYVPAAAATQQAAPAYGGGGNGYGAAAPTPAPPPPPPAAAAPPVPPPWQVHYTAEGTAYYFNAATRETRWAPPTSLV